MPAVNAALIESYKSIVSTVVTANNSTIITAIVSAIKPTLNAAIVTAIIQSDFKTVVLRRAEHIYLQGKVDARYYADQGAILLVVFHIVLRNCDDADVSGRESKCWKEEYKLNA
jgi:hypothetical protein